MISRSKTPLRFPANVARLATVIGFVVVTASAAAASNCPAEYEFHADVIDYHDPDPAKQSHIRGMERNHMNQDVRALRRGQTVWSATGDLRFMLNTVPNHAEALALMLRAGLRGNVERLPEAGEYTVECWLHRATVFRPKDAEAHFLYGTYLGRRGKVEDAISALETADGLRPDDARILYNLGLMYFEKKDYERSLEAARKAYAGGFPLPGLKNKLQQAGHWRE